MELAKAFVTTDPAALDPLCPKVSIHDLHLNLIWVDVAFVWYKEMRNEEFMSRTVEAYMLHTHWRQVTNNPWRGER